MLVIFLEKMSSFWNFFDSQMAIFQRVSCLPSSLGQTIEFLLDKFEKDVSQTMYQSNGYVCSSLGDTTEFYVNTIMFF